MNYHPKKNILILAIGAGLVHNLPLLQSFLCVRLNCRLYTQTYIYTRIDTASSTLDEPACARVYLAEV
jgi:hypothetical protein